MDFIRRQIDSLEVENFRRQREIIEEGDTAFYTVQDMANDVMPEPQKYSLIGRSTFGNGIKNWLGILRSPSY